MVCSTLFHIAALHSSASQAWHTTVTPPPGLAHHCDPSLPQAPIPGCCTSCMTNCAMHALAILCTAFSHACMPTHSSRMEAVCQYTLHYSVGVVHWPA